MKEILLYYTIYSSTAADLIRAMDAAKDSDIEMRVNSGGGETYTTYGIIAKFLENKNNKKLKVDGFAGSMAAFLCCYADDVECLDVSTFVFHRAAFYYEENPNYFTPEVKAEVIEINKNLRAAMEAKMSAAEWEAETGVSYDAMFSLDDRIDVRITAKQAKKLGLVSKVNKITPTQSRQVNAMSMQIAAQYNQPPILLPVSAETPEPQAPTPTKILKPNTMTIQEFKAAHPEAYAAAVKEGVTAERDRVGSFLAFIDVDPAEVAKGIKSGEALTATATAEFSRKEFNIKAGIKAAGENAPEVITEEPAPPATPPTEAAKKMAAFNAEVDAKLGLAK